MGFSKGLNVAPRTTTGVGAPRLNPIEKEVTTKFGIKKFVSKEEAPTSTLFDKPKHTKR